MSKTKLTGLCLVVVCVMCGGLAVSSASAALPELGRCVKVEGTKVGKRTSYSGAYTAKNCVRSSPTHKGRYEFLPGPGAKNKFFATGLEPEPTLETTGGAKVICSSLSFLGGEYTGPKTAKVAKVLFSGCGDAAGVSCQSNPAKESEIEGSGEFTMELGTIKGGEHPTVGWDLKREGAAFVFQCGKLPELKDLQTIEGSVIAPLSTKAEYDVNKMSIKALFVFKQKTGKQLPEMFEGGAKDTLTTTTTTGLNKAVEQTGLSNNLEIESGLGEAGTEKPENQEPLEVKTY